MFLTTCFVLKFRPVLFFNCISYSFFLISSKYTGIQSELHQTELITSSEVVIYQIQVLIRPGKRVFCWPKLFSSMIATVFFDLRSVPYRINIFLFIPLVITNNVPYFYLGKFLNDVNVLNSGTATHCISNQLSW